MMVLERYVYSSRWRRVNPAAKGLFALCGLTAMFLSASPITACGLALVVAAVTLFGSGMPLKNYLRVAAPALLFLACSALSLIFSLSLGGSWGVNLQLAKGEFPHAALVCSRALGGLTSLLFLALTTPMNDIICLLRRLKTPETLLDLMCLCYRMLFVFSEAMHDMHTAQAARLGHSSPRRALRSVGILAANLTLQVWHRSQALHQSALARNNDGPLRFMEPEFPRQRSSLAASALGGGALIALALITT
jgi:cobalt/nickel transport system permease protein